MTFTLAEKLIALALLVAAVVGGAVGVRNHLVNEGVAQGLVTGKAEVQKKWDDQKAVDKAESIRLAAVAEQEKERKANEDSRIAAEQADREKTSAARAAVAVAAHNGLLGAIAALDRDDLSAASANPALAGIARKAALARELLGRCSQRYQSVAEGADQLRDQVVGLQDYAATVCHAPAASAPSSQP